MQSTSLIKVRDDVVPLDLANRLKEKWMSNQFRFYWKGAEEVDNFHWVHHIIPDPGADGPGSKDDHQHLIDKGSIEYELWDALNDNLFGNARLLRYYVNAYTYGVEAYPHRDCHRFSCHERTAIIYLNDDWKPDYEGETVIFNDKLDNIEFACMPKLGRVLYFPSFKLHAARSANRSYPGIRITIACKIIPQNTLRKS